MIACLSVPYFAAAVENRNETPSKKSEKDPGLVLGGQPWEPRPVYAYSREVAQLGVKPGMSLRLAHILSPEARFMAAVPPKYLNASAEITDILTDFTHLIEPEELWLYPSSSSQRDNHTLSGWSRAFGRSLPARFSLDLESLPPAEAKSIAKEMGSVVRRHTRLSPAVGLAENSFAAHVAAALTQPNHARTIMPGEESQFLSSQTIHFLPLEKEAARRLSLLGIRTLGQLTTLPKSTLYAQFGSEFASIYRMAQGYLSGSSLDLLSPLQPVTQEKKERVVHNFDEPISNLLILERVLSRLASELAGRLQASSLEVRTIRLSLEVETGPRPLLFKSHHQPIRLEVDAGSPEASGIITSAVTRRYPTSALQRLSESLKDLLHQAWGQREKRNEHQSDTRGVLALAVELKDLSPAVSLQQLLFSRLGRSDEQNGSAGDPSQAGKVVQSIAARHGKECFYQPVLTDRNHPLPERRFQLRELVPG
jgi:nucleotidyltransferase/DNA polymerase involved in DNA repair